jgi:ATP10 protein
MQMSYKIIACSGLLIAIASSVMLLSKSEATPINTTMQQEIIGSPFPSITVKTLAKEEMNLPNATLGKPTVLCVVFEQNSQAKVDTWTTAILENYKNDSVNYLEIPMISAGYKWVSNFIDNGMRSGVPQNLHTHVATYYGKLDSYKQQLKMTDKNSCYLFLLDKQGIVQHIDSSVANEQKLNTLFTQINKIMENEE